MLATKISSKGQLVVPKEVRTKLKIEPGTFLRVRLDKNNIVLTPIKKMPIDNLYGKFAGEKILDELEKEHAEEIENESRS
ncbi:MAG: AbrB/MazE/SpoVT family DNA-binding domain-containing protein [Desulfobacterales bacterium]|nr:AbrB/MazE/SpoVT family DNA-binding domain-containing protein [Desulfobacterales bacterium]